MDCKKCGTESSENAKFCKKCGERLPDRVIAHSATESEQTKQVFYSEGWPRAKTLAIASVATYDLMVDDQDLYVIKLPASSAPGWGLLIGLIFGRLIGMVIGSAIGEAIAVSKRKSARNTYLTDDHKLISSSYESYVFLKIPIKELKHHLLFEKGKFLVIKYNAGQIILKKSRKEYEVTKDYLKDYVL